MKHPLPLLLALALLPACWSGSSSGGDDDTDTGPDTGSACSFEEFAAQQEALEEAVFAVDPCFHGPASINEDGTLLEIAYNLENCWGFGFEYCNESYQHTAEIEQAAAGVDLSCGPGDAPGVWSGEAYDQLGHFMNLIEEHQCYLPASQSNHVVVEFGEDGSVSEVSPVGDVAQEELDCVAVASTDQVFPCLANLEFCSCSGGFD